MMNKASVPDMRSASLLVKNIHHYYMDIEDIAPPHRMKCHRKLRKNPFVFKKFKYCIAIVIAMFNVVKIE